MINEQVRKPPAIISMTLDLVVVVYQAVLLFLMNGDKPNVDVKSWVDPLMVEMCGMLWCIVVSCTLQRCTHYVRFVSAPWYNLTMRS